MLHARIRRFLGLTQFDVSVGTAIPLSRLSSFERGSCDLDSVQRAALERFLSSRLYGVRDSFHVEKALTDLLPANVSKCDSLEPVILDLQAAISNLQRPARMEKP
jgi:hypothetical protein